MKAKRALSTPILLSVAAALAGCAHYAPVPISTQAIAQHQQQARLDDAAVAARLQAIAPDARLIPGHWDRLSLLAAALLYNPDIAAARAGVATALAKARAAHAAPGPTLTLATEYANDAAASSPWLFGAGLDVPLDIGGVRRARIASANLAVDDAHYAYAEAVWAARMAIDRALVSWLNSRAQAGLYHELADLRSRQLAAMARRVAAGEASRAELERVRADGADAARRAADMDSAALAARTALAGAVGLPTAQLAEIALDWRGFDQPEPLPDTATASETQRQAMFARPDILRAMIAYGQAEQNLRTEVAKQYPALSIGPGYTWERGLVKLPLNIGLVLPPLDANRRAIAAAEATRSEMGQQVEAVVARARTALDLALDESRAARAALTHVRAVELPTAQRLAAQADRELAAGAINRVDWAAAHAGAMTARINEQDALVRVQLADAALEDALHRPLGGPELKIAPRGEAGQ